MKALTKITMFSVALGLYVGCSPVKFALDSSKCSDLGQNCVVDNGFYSIGPSTVTIGGGKVDILIVNDNSASMSFEQKRLAPRFKNFIQDLDNRKVDYRIAMTTTDVSGSRGGQLIYFTAGTAYLTPAHTTREALFNSAIQREETRRCENFIADYLRANGKASINSTAYSQKYEENCPSGDERGIYAANLVVTQNPLNFIRPDAHLSIIFLSDEDERSGLYNVNGGSSYKLDALDYPGTLVNNVKSTHGEEKFNSLSIHSIVVKDNACLAQQNNQILGDTPNPDTAGLVTGSIGNIYLQFNTQGWGSAADICSEDYSSQLGQIRSNISDKIQDIMIACADPKDLVVTISGTPASYRLEGKTLKFSQTLAVGTSVTLSYKCSSL